MPARRWRNRESSVGVVQGWQRAAGRIWAADDRCAHWTP